MDRRTVAHALLALSIPYCWPVAGVNTFPVAISFINSPFEFQFQLVLHRPVSGGNGFLYFTVRLAPVVSSGLWLLVDAQTEQDQGASNTPSKQHVIKAHSVPFVLVTWPRLVRHTISLDLLVKR